jgi:hypothetical protein
MVFSMARIVAAKPGASEAQASDQLCEKDLEAVAGGSYLRYFQGQPGKV